jgi:hypothetical protein
MPRASAWWLFVSRTSGLDFRSDSGTTACKFQGQIVNYRFWGVYVGRAVSIGGPVAILHFGADIKTRWLVAGACLVVVGIVDWIGVARPVKRFEERRKRLADSYIKPWLGEARIGDARPALRANVMIVRRTWYFRKQFVQCYEQGMQGWPDTNLRFPITRGFCGQIFAQGIQDTFYKDLRTATADQLASYGWTQKEQSVTKHVKAVTSTPLLRTREHNHGGTHQEYFGVLNIDATDDLGAEYLANQEVLEKIRSFAEFFQTTFG